ncbi:MAG: hypothetical protein ACU0DK_16265 [Pseudooceanicola sp.]
MDINAPSLPPRDTAQSAGAAVQTDHPMDTVPVARPGPDNRARRADGTGGFRDRIASRLAHRRRMAGALREVSVGRGAAFFDGFLLLLAICAMLLPTTAGYSLASAAAHSVIGLPFAVLMFLSPFAIMALLPLRLLHLALDGFFGIRLRLGLLAPLSLVCLAIFLFLGPLNIRPGPSPATMAIGEVIALHENS